MVVRRSIACCVLLLVLAGEVWADGEVQVTVRNTIVTVGRPFSIQLEASGGSVGKVEVPEADGLVIQESPRTTSQQMTFINGVQSASVRMGFLAVARQAGTITVPAFGVSIDGTTYYSEALELTAVGPDEVPEKPRQKSSGEQKELRWDDLVFCEMAVDKREVFQGEAVTLKLGLYALEDRNVSVNAQRNSPENLPSTEGFYVIPEMPQKTGSRTENRNDLTYHVEELEQTLYPTAPGTLTVGPWRWQGWAVARTNFGRQQHSYELETEPIEILVKPLPERPANFSGAVGTFRVEAQVSPRDTVQNMPVTLVVRIIGAGNPDAIGAPHVPEIEGARLGDPMRSNQPVRGDGSLVVSKSYSYEITPVKAGKLTVPAFDFCSFDPAAGEYKVQTAGPFDVHVQASGEKNRRLMVGGDVGMNKGSVDVIANDIRPIAVQARRLHPQANGVAPLCALAILPMLAYAGFAAYMARKRRFAQDKSFARAYHAKSKGRKRLEGVAGSTEPAEELYRAIVGYLADAFDVSDAGMTSSDARNLLQARGIDEELAESFEKMLRACERARYATAALSDTEIHAMTDAAAQGIERLEADLKKGRRS